MCAAAHHYHYGDGRASSAEMYLHRLSGQEREPHIVSMDHSYAKAWNAHPDSHHAKPAKLLFMKDVFFSESKTAVRENVAVNVESWKAVATPPYDGSKTRNLMSECERSAALSSRPDTDSSTWDEDVKRQGWTTPQHRVFNQVTRLLHADRLARLAYKGNANEPVLRRLAVDRTARRLRRIMGSFSWDMKLLHWLHQLLMEKASTSYLAAYLDALQALRAQIPQLIDKLVARSTVPGRAAGPDALGMLLRRPWDPVAPFLSQHKPKRLPCSPLLVVCPGGPRPQASGGGGGGGAGGSLPRSKFWTSQLSVLGKLVAVNPVPPTPPSASLNQVLEAMVAATRAKVLELKSHFSSRPIILIGWMIGGLVACQVSLLESVAAVVCLGFPLVGMSGSRDVDDPLLDSHTPTLFVVGQNALSCGMDELENFREHMKAESGLVVVGGADDSLHMCALKKRLEGVTQSMVDRCVLDEVGSFLQWVLSAPHMGPGGGAASKAAGAAAAAAAASAASAAAASVRRRAQPLLPESSHQVALGRRRGRQCRPYFYQPPPPLAGSGGSSSVDTTPGSSPMAANFAAAAAAGVHTTKRGSGRRVGRPPKQVAEKRAFGSFAARKVPRSLAGQQQRKRPPIFPPTTTWPAASPGQSVTSPQQSEQGLQSLSLGVPALSEDTASATEEPTSQLSGTDGADLMPTSSLWSQSLIADPASSFSSSPMSSPLHGFQQKASCGSGDHLAMASPMLRGDAVSESEELLLREPQHRALGAGLVAGSMAPLPAQEEGRFVSLAESGIRMSLLQKSLRPAALQSSEPQAAWSSAGSETSSNPVYQMVLPASSALSMVVAPARTEPPAGHSGLHTGDTMGLGDDEEMPESPGGESSTALEMLAEASSTHQETAGAYDGQMSGINMLQATIGEHSGLSQVGRGATSWHRIPFPLMAAGTRTRKVRMPRFYDI